MKYQQKYTFAVAAPLILFLIHFWIQLAWNVPEARPKNERAFSQDALTDSTQTKVEASVNTRHVQMMPAFCHAMLYKTNQRRGSKNIHNANAVNMIK